MFGLGYCDHFTFDQATNDNIEYRCNGKGYFGVPGSAKARIMRICYKVEIAWASHQRRITFADLFGDRQRHVDVLIVRVGCEEGYNTTSNFPSRDFSRDKRSQGKTSRDAYHSHQAIVFPQNNGDE